MFLLVRSGRVLRTELTQGVGNKAQGCQKRTDRRRAVGPGAAGDAAAAAGEVSHGDVRVSTYATVQYQRTRYSQ